MNDGRKRQGQKHQNKTAFKIMFNPLALDTHKKVSFKGLCKRCADQLDWKLKYNKYKKMAELAKCTFCHQKNVTRTYMRACEPCYEAQKVCPKCLEAETEEQIEVKLNEAEQKKQEQENEKKMNEFVKTLKERSRRTVRRLMEKGTIRWNEELNNFVDEEDQPLALQFRNGFANSSKNSEANDDDEDIDEFGEDSDDEHDSEDEEDKEEEKKEKKGKEIKKGKEVQQTQDKKEQTKEESKDKEEEEEKEQEDDDGEESDDQEEDQEEEQAEEYEEEEKEGEKSESKAKPVEEVASQSTVPVVVGQPQNDQDWQDVDQQQN